MVVFAQQAEANNFFVSFYEEQIRSESKAVFLHTANSAS